MPGEGQKGTAACISDAPRLVQTACERCDARSVKQQGQVSVVTAMIKSLH